MGSPEEEDIDDDDRELLKENLGIDFVKKRKRIRMESGSEDSASEGEGVGDEIPDIEEKEDGGSANEFEEDDFIVDAEGKPLRSERKKKKTHIFQDEERQMEEDYEEDLEDLDDDQREQRIKEKRAKEKPFL